MIITRAPLRLPLGGGGTDLPAYYTQYGGFLTSVALDKYVYIAVKRRFDDSLRVSYSKTEVVETPDALEHPIVRETLKFLGITGGVEIVSIADVPANTGLGSSGAFTVALLLALHTYRRENRTPQELAEESFHIQADRLRDPIGKQDEYLAAFGGLTTLDIAKDGAVAVSSVAMDPDVREVFDRSLLLFYTGIRRKSSDILAGQQQAVQQRQATVSDALHRIKEIGREITVALVEGNPRRIGELFHEHWESKQRVSASMAPPEVQRWYALARAQGALGGKLVGAGGGGFLLCYCDGDPSPLRRALAAEGLKEMRFTFAPDGARVLINLEEHLWVQPAGEPRRAPLTIAAVQASLRGRT